MTKPPKSTASRRCATSRPDDPAVAMQAARDAHATERIEDYVEAIDELVQQHGKCRVTDLAKYFGVTHVTAIRAVAVLEERGLATTEPYRPIELTADGQSLAREARQRHELVFRFLLTLGLDEETAAIDAEGIEHHLSPKTLSVIQTWVDRLNATPRPGG